MKKILITISVFILAGALWAAGDFFNETGVKRTAATGVTLNKTSLTLEKGASETLTATVTPSGASDKRVTWVSYDETIATVSSSGKVKAVSPGTTTVRAKTRDGGFTAKCKVKVVIPVTGLSVSPTSLTVVKGKTKTITAKVSPSSAADKRVTWVSYDESIATVSSSGVVKGVKAGSTTVRAKTRDGGFTAKCKVKVKNPSVAVTGVSLDKTSATIGPGQALALVPKITPSNATNKAVTWVSYDESVATVNAGVVKALKEGSTTVRVKTKDGGYTAKCKITVKKVAVTGVSVTPSSLTLEPGDTAQLAANVKPANAYDKTVTWKSDDKTVATVTNKGVVKAVAEGTAKITVTTADGGFTAKCSVTVVPSTQSVTKISPEEGQDLNSMGQVIKVKVKLSSANKDKAVTYKWTVNGGSAKGVIVDADEPAEVPATGKERVYTKRVKIADEDRNIVLKVYVDSQLIGTLKYFQKSAAPPSIE